MSFVCFVIATILGVLAWLVGATWINGEADLLKWQALTGLAFFFVSLGLAVGAPRSVR